MRGHPEDVRAIVRLRERDATASRTCDFATLRGIVSDDAVVLPPGGKPIAGKAAIDAFFRRAARAPMPYEVLEYRFDLSEPQFAGDLAVEYGAIHGRTRDRATGKESDARYNVLRVLRRESDGEWRVFRSIWTPTE